jgi:surfactin synthase thioesterase subunit
MSQPAGPLTLFCLPYAGGSAAAYLPWQRLQPVGLLIKPVELPGHGRRLDEEPVDDLDALVARLATELAGQLPARYALFGHSLGALIGFELTHTFARQGLPSPQALFVSASSAPSRRDDARYLALAATDHALLKDELRRLGGTPEELLDNEELMALMLPIVAADFRLCASFAKRDRPQLSCPLHVFGGEHDTSVPAAALAAWQRETRGSFSVERFDGGHFYLQRHAETLLRRIDRLVSRQVAMAA